MPGAYHALRFHQADGADDLLIDTTRPELLAACVAVVAHPDDARYQPLFGTEVITPLYGVSVPVVAHHLADPEKGTGIAMICTFGDTTDVVWWRELQLPTRAILGIDGRFKSEPPDGLAAGGAAAYAEIVGQEREAGAEDRRRAAAGVGRARRRAPPDHAPGEVLREGRTPARDRHVAPVVPPQRRPRPRPARRAARTRHASSTGTRRPCASATTRGSTGSTPTGSSAASATSACRSRSGTASTPTATRRTTTRRCPPRTRCPSTPPPTARPASPRRSATSPAASRPTPTSWTRGPRRRSRRRSRPAGSTIPTCSSARSR